MLEKKLREELEAVDDSTQKLSRELIDALRRSDTGGAVVGSNFARFEDARFAGPSFRDRYVGVGGWTDNSRIIKIGRAIADDQDKPIIFHPESGERLAA